MELSISVSSDTVNKMTNLHADLSDYLSRNKSKIGLNLIPIAIPSLQEILQKSPLGKSTSAASPSSSLCPSLTRFQRLVGFCICLGLSLFFYTLSAFYIPMLMLQARKFALLYTLGSTSFFTSFVLLRGPVNFLKLLISKNQWIFLTVFVAAFIATLYFAVWEHDTVLTIVFALIQSLSLLHYLFSCMCSPGIVGFTMFSKLFSSNSVTSTVTSAISTTFQTTEATKNYIREFV